MHSLQQGPLTHLSNANEQQADLLLAFIGVLYDKARFRIIQLLLQNPDGLSGQSLTAELKLSQPTVSYHLRRLASVGLVTFRQQGRFHIYQLVGNRIKEFGAALEPR